MYTVCKHTYIYTPDMYGMKPLLPNIACCIADRVTLQRSGRLPSYQNRASCCLARQIIPLSFGKPAAVKRHTQVREGTHPSQIRYNFINPEGKLYKIATQEQRRIKTVYTCIRRVNDMVEWLNDTFLFSNLKLL